MQIAQNHMVEMDYRLTDGSGTLIDSSEGHGPLSYVQGMGQIIPGLEAAMEGRKVGEAFSVVVQPSDAYGDKNDDLILTLPRDDFSGIPDLEAGMQVEMNDGQNVYVMTVVEISESEVSVDGNHPLAGVPLHFDITVKSVRMATAEELAPSQGCGCGGDCSDDSCESDGCGCDDSGCGCH